MSEQVTEQVTFRINHKHSRLLNSISTGMYQAASKVFRERSTIVRRYGGKQAQNLANNQEASAASNKSNKLTQMDNPDYCNIHFLSLSPTPVDQFGSVGRTVQQTSQLPFKF